MRDLVMLALLLGLLALGFRNAFGMYVLWGWSGLIGLAGKMYGFMQSLQFVLLFALSSLILILLRRDPKMGSFKFTGLHAIYVLFALQALITATFAFDGVPRSWEIAIDLIKTLVYGSLMSLMVTSRFRAYVIVLFIVSAMGYYGATEGLKFIASGGAHISQGDARLGDNNHFAVLVGSSIPLMLYVLIYAETRVMKFVMTGLIIVTVLSVVTTYSRGGMLTLAAMGFLFVLRSRKKFLGLAVVAALAIVVVVLAPDAWVNRMGSIKSADSDSSFMGRVKAWKRSSEIALDRPLVGGGFQAVQSEVVFERYRYAQGILGFVDTSPATYAAAAHSIYFEVMGDMGFLGFFTFVGIMMLPFLYYSKGKRFAQRIGPRAQWAVDLLSMLTVGQFGYLVGGASISVAYYEVAYLYVALSASLVAILQAEVARATPSVSTTSSLAAV